ncbi:MAG TPA: hypothetical protein VJ875_15615 [Pyrinomonadaceae bacterium]|nr:hypothetical protein [Pyrinomonadaceae bacterium]
MGIAVTNRLSLVAVCVALLATGCGSSPDIDDSGGTGAPGQTPPQTSGVIASSGVVPRAQSDDDLIVGDISNSLQGFASKAPKQIETLYRVLLRNSASPRLAKMPGDNSPVQELGLQEVKMFSRADSYVGATTPLVETISQGTAAHRSVIIVTDGMESDNFYLKLQETMVPLAQQGWGMWILLLPLPFEGKYHLEQPLNPEVQLSRMQACVQQKNSAWQVSPIPKALSSVHFSGERPLLLFVLDRDPEHGRRLVSTLTKEIEAELSKPESVELSPLYLREYTVSAVDPETLGVQLLGGPSASDQTLVTDSEDNGPIKKLLFHLSWRKPPGFIPQPFDEQWELKRVKDAKWANLQIVKSRDEKKSPGDLSLTLDCEPTTMEWIKSFYASPIVRDERMTFRVGSILQKPLQGWWNEWNAVTTWECPHKVFKLASLVERVSSAARERLMKTSTAEEHKLKLQIGTR